METIIIIVFVAGYLAITLEHSLKIDKLVPALVMMAICWAFISFGVDDFKSWFDSSSHKLLNNFFDINGREASSDELNNLNMSINNRHEFINETTISEL